MKSVTGGNNTVYYNGAESDYQPDAYGNTKREYWSKTGYEMEYVYDTLNRLISVKTPDGKSENYTYNKNSQITAINGLIKGTLSYNKAKLGTVNLECGIKKSLSYNDAGLISGIAYSSDKNSSLTTGYEYLYDRNFNITERTHKDTGNKDTFTYDSLNRLVSSKLKGKFTNDTYEQFAMYNMNEIDRDIDGMKNEGTLNGQFFPADKVTLDEKGKSFVYDFAGEKEIQRIELFKTNLEKNSRIRERDLHIYIKLDEVDEWSELTPDCWNYEVDSKNQSIHFNLKETLKTRFIKIRTIWDDRDIDNNNVSEYVTFTNESVQKMIRIWTIENSKDEFYKYDKNSNRITLETYTTKNDYAYYKNADNGNTARVMYDGKWWYTYDANGNRTARARNAEHNGNDVNIDKSDEYWEYEWDYHNRLVKVQQYNAPDNSSNVCVEYVYDAMNRRIERISYTGETSELTQYAYGRNGALTYQEKTAGSSVTTRSFVYLNNQIAGFMDTENGIESIRYAVTDIQGSVTEVYDEDNRLLWKSGYTAFGIKAGETTNLIDFEGLYTGCDIDAETGLTYHWNRWRSEDGDSWLSQDPARDGLNWYGYAGQNPVNFIDVIGLFYYNADGQHSSSEEYEKKDITTIHSDESNNANSNLPENKTERTYFKNDPDYLLNRRPKSPYRQNSPELEFIKNMKEFGCNFMSELFGVQKATGVNFSALEIYSLVGYLQEKDNPSPNASEGEKCLTEEMDLRNPDELINKAFEMAGEKKTGKVNWGNEKDQKPSWNLIKGKTPLNNDHYQYTDNEGNLRWDPYYEIPIEMKQIEILRIYIFER